MTDYYDPHETRANTANLGFLLAKALQRWNELLYAAFEARGYPEVRAAYGSILLPLFEEEGLTMGELARRARLSKQTLTTLIRDMRSAGLVRRIRDAADARAYRIYLSGRAQKFKPVAEEVLAELDAAVEELLSPQARVDLERSLIALIILGQDAELPTPGAHRSRETDHAS